jgi:serine/threonine-protein kinase RIO1
MFAHQKVISTRKFLSSFARLSRSEEKDNGPIYYLIVKNGEEAGIYIPPQKIDDFIKIQEQNLIQKKEKSKYISLEDSFKKIKFKGNQNLSQDYKKILYNE